MLIIANLELIAAGVSQPTQNSLREMAQELLYLRPHTTTPAAAPRFACVEVKISATEGEGL